jgi:hypothetical protein
MEQEINPTCTHNRDLVTDRPLFCKLRTYRKYRHLRERKDSHQRRSLLQIQSYSQSTQAPHSNTRRLAQPASVCQEALHVVQKLSPPSPGRRQIAAADSPGDQTSRSACEESEKCQDIQWSWICEWWVEEGILSRISKFNTMMYFSKSVCAHGDEQKGQQDGWDEMRMDIDCYVRSIRPDLDARKGPTYWSRYANETRSRSIGEDPSWRPTG